MLPALAMTKPPPSPWRIGELIRVPLLGIGISSAPTSASGRFEIRVRFRQRQGNNQVSSPSPSDNAHGIDVQIFTSRLQAPTQGNLYALLCISGFTIPHNRRRRHRQNPDVLTVMLVTLVTPVTHTKSERPNDLNIPDGLEAAGSGNISMVWFLDDKTYDGSERTRSICVRFEAFGEASYMIYFALCGVCR
ncbi:hypothetical protein D9758_016533 [Tetrapyrgos nigripes]|uniref:Uncharacterized protein n=1 Tax=Tetrapyrgos nigripes TaxID=182062 RepID=A0A8H5FIY9_9AGAR|nr:hypothetical protein D9758_016533 [Tetrapyrgos nigripes]